MALDLAPTITLRGPVLSERIRRVGEAAAEIGDVEAARAAADAIDDDAKEKALALVALARALMKSGATKAARATLDEALTQARGVGPRANFINDDPVRNADSVFREVALAQAEAGDVKAALASIASRGSDTWKSEVLGDVAPIQARQGDIPGALATARSIPDPARAGEAYCEIASIQSCAAGADPVRAWIDRLEPQGVRTFALIGVAEGVAARKSEKRADGSRDP